MRFLPSFVLIIFCLLQGTVAISQAQQYYFGVPVLDTIYTYTIVSQDSCSPNYNVQLSSELFNVTGLNLYLIIDTINAPIGSVSTDPGSVLNLGDTLPIPSADTVNGSYKFYFATGAGAYISCRLMAEGIPTVIGESYVCDSLMVVGLPVTCQSAMLLQGAATCTVGCGVPPVAGFKNKITAVGGDYLVDFIDTSSYASTWLWDFDDGATATTQNTSHVYADSGLYNVCLTITHTCGSDTVCTGVTAYCKLPEAEFSAEVIGAGVILGDSSVAATSWIWDFGDGNQSTLQNPFNLYSANGTYTICLIVGNACGLDTLCQDVTINCLFPSAAFSTDTVDTSIYTIVFTDLSTTAQFWSWDFGGVGVSMDQNPVYTFPALSVSASYLVCLEVTNNCGADSSCQTVDIPAPLGIESRMIEPKLLMIHPNPFSDIALIGISPQHYFDEATLEIFNVMGKIIISKRVSGNREIVLHAEQLTPGLYTVRIVTGQGSLYQGRAVVIR